MNERIKELCKANGITFAALEKRLGMGNATLKKANEKMQAVRLKALADYFGVSMEYLLTGVKTPQDAISGEERELLHLYRKLNATGRSALLEHASDLSDLPKYTQEKVEGKVG